MRTHATVLRLASVLASLVIAAPPAVGEPLLMLDFGRQISGVPDSPALAGFEQMIGAGNEAVASKTFGPYTVNVDGQGFWNSADAQASVVDPSVRDFYRDYFYNNSTINGNGVLLQLLGFAPGTYNLTLWSYDAQNPEPTVTVWTPFGDATGAEGRVTNVYAVGEPPAGPAELLDPDHHVTMQVTTSSGAIDVFGTSNPPDAPSGNGGTRLNGFIVNDGVSDLLKVDFAKFGTPAGDPSPVQAGYTGVIGDQLASYTEAVGDFTITLEGQGFWNATNATRLANMDPAVADFFRDYYYNNSTLNGEGVTLTIEGVQPNTDYDLKLWSYDNDNNSPTDTVWTPFDATTGETAVILNDRDAPWPQTFDDHSGTVTVRSTTTTLKLFGTTTGGTGGTRLNGLQLDLAAAGGAPGDFNGDSFVDGADLTIWNDNFGTGSTASTGDADNDADVDGNDFLIWQRNVTAPAAAAVPEPQAAALALAAAALLLRRGGRRTVGAWL